jgi:hypothetical protein
MSKPAETVQPAERSIERREDAMSAILEILLSLLDFLSIPSDLRQLRAKRRREMEALDRRPAKEWEGLVCARVDQDQRSPKPLRSSSERSARLGSSLKNRGIRGAGES